VVLSLSLGILVSSVSADLQSDRTTTVYQRTRSFRVPFNLNPSDQSKRRELQLWVSTDSGASWKPKDSTTSNQAYFTFEAPQDGEFWLAVRSLDSAGRLHPGTNDQITPNMKVVVDTKAPTLTILPEDRSASLASLRWEIHEEHPDLETLRFEYLVEGTKEWRPVPKQRAGWNGVATWDAGFAERLKVRASVMDRAGNKSQMIVRLPGAETDGSLMASRSERYKGHGYPSTRLAARVDPFRMKGQTRSTPAPMPKRQSLAHNDDRYDNPSRPLLDLQTTSAASPPVESEIADLRVEKPLIRQEDTASTASEAPDRSQETPPQALDPAALAKLATSPSEVRRPEPAASEPRASVAKRGSVANSQPMPRSLAPSLEPPVLPSVLPRQSRPRNDHHAKPAEDSRVALLSDAPVLPSVLPRQSPPSRDDQSKGVEDSRMAFASNATLQPSVLPRNPRPRDDGFSKQAEDSIFGDIVPGLELAKRRPQRGEDPEVGTVALNMAPASEKPGSPALPASSSVSAGEIPSLRVSSPRFALDYAVEDAGPEGPVLIDLWVTRDGGRSWAHRGNDPDNRPPINIDLEGEGAFGVSLIARDREGRGERVPAPGDAPQIWVEVVPQEPQPDPVGSSRSNGFLQRVFGK